jgi:hypothetical protein
MEDTIKDNVISLAKEKQSLLERFLRLTEEQEKALKNNSYESLLNIINNKQLIIERVNLLNLEIKGAKPEKNETLKMINI